MSNGWTPDNGGLQQICEVIVASRQATTSEQHAMIQQVRVNTDYTVRKLY